MEGLWDEALRRLSPGKSLFKVLVYLSFKGRSRPAEIAEETGLSPGTVRPALRNLLNMGLVRQEEDGSYISNIHFTEIVSDIYRRLPRE
ncbi:helix-turn-helix transcriptional regulator [Candidatus Bathyarchaeota archaeon]|nr:helix-turn-helix transcriptional regulator [Candidatus Bathyarchaeota archaeon]